jgi:hypothetical protein
MLDYVVGNFTNIVVHALNTDIFVSHAFHFQAGVCEPSQPESLLIALEPEVASICCRKLRLNQLVPERPIEQTEPKMKRASSSTLSLPLEPTGNNLVLQDSREGNSLNIENVRLHVPVHCFHIKQKSVYCIY